MFLLSSALTAERVGDAPGGPVWGRGEAEGQESAPVEGRARR